MQHQKKKSSKKAAVLSYKKGSCLFYFGRLNFGYLLKEEI